MVAKIMALAPSNGDADVVVIESRCDAAGPSMHVSVRWLLDGGTQSMPLSAAIMHQAAAPSALPLA